MNQPSFELSQQSTIAEKVHIPLSPVLSTKHNVKQRRENRKRLSNRYSQNSSSQESNASSKSEITEIEIENENILKERLKRCEEIRKNKKFRYDIAASSSKNDTFNKFTDNNVDFKVPAVAILKDFKPKLDLNVGFKFVSGKEIKISERSLQKASKLFETEEHNHILNSSKMSTLLLFEDFDKKNQNEKENVIPIEKEEDLLINLHPKVKKIDSTPNENQISNFTQFSDTQMCLAIENAECMINFVDNQWSSQEKDSTLYEDMLPTKKPCMFNNNKSITFLENSEEFESSEETDQLFGNITIAADGSLISRDDCLDVKGFTKEDILLSLETVELHKNIVNIKKFEKEAEYLYKKIYSSQKNYTKVTQKNSRFERVFCTKTKKYLQKCGKSNIIKSNQKTNPQKLQKKKRVKDVNKKLQTSVEDKIGTRISERIINRKMNQKTNNLLINKKNWTCTIIQKEKKDVNEEKNEANLLTSSENLSDSSFGEPTEIFPTPSTSNKNFEQNPKDSLENKIESSKKLQQKTSNLLEISKSTLEDKKVTFLFSEKISRLQIKNTSSEHSNTSRKYDENIQIASFGFKMASGKQPVLSKKSLDRAKNVFKDIDTLECEASNIGFKHPKVFCSNPKLSKEFLEPAENILPDVPQLTKENGQQKSKALASGSRLCGFKTASGKQPILSKKSLDRAKNLYKDIDLLEENLENQTEFEEFLEPPEHILPGVPQLTKENDQQKSNALHSGSRLCGFKTASGKQPILSKKSLDRAKNIFKDIDLLEENLENQTEFEEFLEPPEYISPGAPQLTKENDQQKSNALTSASKFCGFKTASGKQPILSKKSLDRAKNVFKDIDLLEENLKNQTEFEEFLEPNEHISPGAPQLTKENDQQKSNALTSGSKFCGFKTASGKQPILSKKSLDRAKNIFKDIDKLEENLEKQNSATDTEESFKTERVSNNSIEHSKSNLFRGFKIVSGREPIISKKSSERAEILFKAINNLENEKMLLEKSFLKPKQPNKLKPVNNNQPCTSTSEKKTHVENSENMHLIGFKMVSGKEPILSKKSLERAKNLFKNIDEIEFQKEAIVDEEFFKLLKTPNSSVAEENVATKTSSFQNSCKTPNNQSIISVEKLDKTLNLKASGVNEEESKKCEKILEDLADIEEEFFNENIDNFCQVLEKNNEKCPKPAPQKISQIKGEKLTEKETIFSPAPIKRSVNSPQLLNENCTPKTRNSCSRSLKKRKLGISSSSFRIIEIPEQMIKRAKLNFEEVETPKKAETKNNHSPNISNKTILNSSTPINKIEAAIPEKRITIEKDEIKDDRVVISSPPLQNTRFSLPKHETKISHFSLKEKSIENVEKTFSNYQKRCEILQLEISVMKTRMDSFKHQQELKKNAPQSRCSMRRGSLFMKKTTSERISLKEAVNNRNPKSPSNEKSVDPIILQINSENASKLQFLVPWWPNNFKTYPAVIRTEDEAIIIPDHENFVGVNEIEMGFLTMPGVDLKLIPDNWVKNHYRWIVWKLASLERRFPEQFEGSLSIENVVAQLKYRYDLEIDGINNKPKRSALKMILQRDDTSSRRMILCVASIIQLPENNHELLLTDGWYSIKATIDIPLNSLVNKKVIKEGLKLIISGAELINCEACHPLEVPESARMQIHYNATRRTVWHSKLGFTPNPHPFCINLCNINTNGGQVLKTLAYIARVYPISFMEHIDDKRIWRNKKAEEIRANQWEAGRESLIEKLRSKIVNELEEEDLENKKKNKENLRILLQNVAKVNDPKDLFLLYEESNDPDSLKELLSPNQVHILINYQNQLNLEKQSELTKRLSYELNNEKMNKRNVSPVLKLLLLDVNSPSHQRTLSIWYPTESHLQMLKEGIAVNIYNISVRNNWSLSSSPRTQFELFNKFDSNKFTNFYRTVTPIAQTLHCDFKPAFLEFDTIGIVVHIDIQQENQSIWIADADFKFLSIMIREGSQTCCLLDHLKTGNVIAAANLLFQKPAKNHGKAEANHYSLISVNPMSMYLRDFLQEFQNNLPTDLEEYIEKCKQLISNYNYENNLKNNMQFEYFKNTSDSFMQNNTEFLTVSDEEMSLIDTQLF